MTVKVTLMDVLMGARRQPGFCMVARAVKRQRPDLNWITVGTDRMDAGARTYLLPEFVVAKIWKWDRWGLVMPFSFELPLEQRA